MTSYSGIRWLLARLMTRDERGGHVGNRGRARRRAALSTPPPSIPEQPTGGEVQARREAAAQIAFYAAPRTYGTVVDVAGFSEAGERIRAAFASRDFDAMAAAVPDAMVDAMSASGTPAQVGAKLEEFGRHIDHVIVYPASFGMTDERSRQVTADLLKAATPG